MPNQPLQQTAAAILGSLEFTAVGAAGATELDRSAWLASARSSVLVPGVGVGEREVAAAQQAGDGPGVEPVTLGLAAVDRFHGPGVP
jgi:hypothetical protein